MSSNASEVALRPVREEDLPKIEALTQDPASTGEFEWFGWPDPRRWRRGWEDNGLLGPEGGTLIVTCDEQFLGLVDWRQHQIPGSFSWEIGIVLLPEARGRGYGTQAQVLLVRYLFAHTTVHRIWAGTEAGNIAEQKALEKAGFTREGVTRATGWRNGAWRDGVIYSILRTDPALSRRR